MVVLIDSRAFDKDYQFDWKTKKSKKNIKDEIEENNLRTNKDGILRTYYVLKPQYKKKPKKRRVKKKAKKKVRRAKPKKAVKRRVKKKVTRKRRKKRKKR